jgi:hypothetical protein
MDISNLPSGIVEAIEKIQKYRSLLPRELHHHAFFAPDTPQSYVDLYSHKKDKDHTDLGQDLFFPEEIIPTYRQSYRWTRTALSGSNSNLGDPMTVTWSIAPDGTIIPGFNGEPQAPSNLVNFLSSIYGSNSPGDGNYTNEPWFDEIKSTFDRWSQVSGLTYIYEPNDDGITFSNSTSSTYWGVWGTRGDVRVGGHPIDGNSNILAYNFYPTVGDMVIDSPDSFYNTISSNSIRLRNVLVHEEGHGLGLAHVESSDGNFLMEPYLNTVFDGPQFDDIMGAHRAYGDFYEGFASATEALNAHQSGNPKPPGNDTYSNATSLGVLSNGVTKSIGTNAFDALQTITPAMTDFVSIDDNSDTDFYSFTITNPSSVDLTLIPKGPTYQEGPQGGTQSPFNAKAQSDLSLFVYSIDGTTLLGSSNTTGLGGTESIADLALSTLGTYYVRVSGAQDAVQMYQLELFATALSLIPGITVTTTSITTTEAGGAGTFNVVLNTQPTSNVTINLSSSDLTEGIVSTNTLTFTPQNWSTAQTVTVTGVNDNIDDGDINYNVNLNSTSSDSGYNGLTKTVTATNTDNDTAGITVTPTSLTTTEAGGSASFTVVLNSEPTGDVTLALNSSDITEGTIDKSSLTFTSANWNQAQTVTVTGVDDNLVDGNINYTITTASAVSTDSKYNGLNPSDVSVTNIDNEASTPILYFSLLSNGTVGGVSVANEDIVSFDGTKFEVYFDGTAQGLSNFTIDAFDIISDTEILVSFAEPTSSSLKILGTDADDSDIVKLTKNPNGTYSSSLYFDASDVGLTTNNEDVDAVSLLSNGDFLISTTGSFGVTGISGTDADLIRFTPTAQGSTTSGTWSWYFDGSDVGLSGGSSEDVDALGLKDGKLYLSTTGNFSVTGISGADEDIFVFTPSSTGSTTAGTYNSSLFFDGSVYGLSSNDILAIDIPV